MITLAQMQDERRGVEYSDTLTQADIEAINQITTDWDAARRIAASWAHQYHFDGIAEEKTYRQFKRNAY